MTATARLPRTSLLSDPAMDFLAPALGPELALPALRQPGGPLADLEGPARIERITPLRHKPGRRCLIEYVVDTIPRYGSPRRIVLLGKTRVKGLDRKAVTINSQLWHAGFRHDSQDGVSVPRPLGVVPDFRMWFQERVPGEGSGIALAGPDGARVAERIAAALLKLQRTAPVHHRQHTITDELAILSSRLDELAGAEPGFGRASREIMRGCERLAIALPPCPPAAIHRDFYQENILVDGERVWILDLDLYARGHPATDAGNLSAHLIELALRGAAEKSRMEAVIERFTNAWLLGWQGARSMRDVEAFTTLALARLLAISVRFPERRDTTSRLVDLCLQRLRAATEPTAPGI